MPIILYETKSMSQVHMDTHIAHRSIYARQRATTVNSPYNLLTSFDGHTIASHSPLKFSVLVRGMLEAFDVASHVPCPYADAID